jgi:Zn-finger nucleic acid-binding protein
MRHLVACQHCHAQYDVTDFEHRAVRCRCGMLLAIAPPAVVERPVTRCGHCGGPMAPEALRCPYCAEAPIRDDLSLSCPECFARMSSRSKFCCSCGVEIHPESLTARPTEMTCPRCEGRLFSRQIAEYPVSECGHCHGIWVGAQLFSRLVNKLAKERAEVAEAESAAPPRASPDPIRYLKCPECGKLMNRRNFENVSGIVLDQCSCGWWFDATELESVARFIAGGGLIRARKAELEYQQMRLESAGSQQLDRIAREPHSPTGVMARGFMSLFGLKD